MNTQATRRGVMLIVAASALAGGVWWAERRPPAGSPAAQTALDKIIATPLERPQGGSLDLSGLRGRPVLINFWATWCPPCVKEMPEIDAFFLEHQQNGWQVVGIAVDRPEAVMQFLGKTPVKYPIAMAGFAGVELTRALGNVNGGLPFTLMLDARGNVRWKKSGETSAAELKAQAAQTL